MKSEAKFWSRVADSGFDQCWVWLGARNNAGYGKFWPARKADGAVMAHRHAYELMVAEIPAGLVLDHLCRNVSCVNPYHLDPVPNGVNVRRGMSPSSINRGKTHCINGHEFDEANTRITPSGERACRACHRNYMRAWKLARKAG